MQSRVAILLTVVIVVVLLVGLNAASYVRVEREAEFEINPHRSTTNAGPTGTRALYDFLTQSGQKVARWTLPASALADEKADSSPSTFVVIGETRSPFDEQEAQELRRWVRRGGRLVLIDRTPDARLLPTSDGWRVGHQTFALPDFSTLPDNAEAMTAGVSTIAPLQPTLLTRDVERVSPSRFAGRLHIYAESEKPVTIASGGGIGPRATPAPAPPPPANRGAGGGSGREEDEAWWEEEEDEQPPPPPEPVGPPDPIGADEDGPPAAVESSAPVIHLADGRAGEGALLVDYVYGLGRIVVLSDPYIVSNAGISRADNLQLAANVVRGQGGLVAFDEYHQGFGTTRNQTLAYFAGTPVLWIFAQAVALVLAVVWARSRRFARPLPAPHVDRRSSLEFVSSMAELQQRARAYDLAIENVYSRTRRALARYAGLQPATAHHGEIAARVAARSGKDARAIEELLRECDEAAAGATLSARKALSLVARLRDLEGDLGIRMRAREIRQSGRR